MTRAVPSNEVGLEALTFEECITLLRQGHVGRIAVEAEGGPIILPVNYRLAEAPGRTWVALRTRHGNVIESASMRVAFEIDTIESGLREGRSVLVQGTLHRVDTEAADFAQRFDSEPWIVAERDAWLIIEPFAISGRRLHAADREWAFHTSAHL